MVKIRSATVDDISVMHGFVEELEEQKFDSETFRMLAAENLNNPNCYYFIAEMNSDPVGFVSLHVQTLLHHLGKTGEIQELYVKADFRNHSIGKLLIEQVEKTAAQLNLLEIEVTAQVRRLHTHAFYQKQGYGLSHYKFTKEILSL
jgi:PhnO protein